MTPAELQSKLDELKSLPAETEWVEFKLNDHGPEKYPEIGEYLSAIANSLALLRKDRGYIVWGIDDKAHELRGTDFKPRLAKHGNEELEHWLTRSLDPQITFKIHEADLNGQHFVLFEVGPATHTPVRFYGTEYIRVGSLKKKLGEYREKQRELWKVLSPSGADWSAAICDGATLKDLEPAAIAFARQEFKKKNTNLATEVDAWSDETFLNKAKVCIDGKITRTAIILLGKPESDHYLGHAHPQLSWILKDADGLERDYKHYGPPFLLAVDELLARIRNLTCRVLPWGTLFPVELLQYDPWVLRETLHNAIAHQDYSISGRINVVEFEDRLIVVNHGSFLPGDVESVIRRDSPLSVYRNSFLAQAMVGLQMIDTIGSGIKRIFQAQKKRSFPMPDFDLSNPTEVKVVISNRVLDERYTRMLLAREDLGLWDVIALDKVQKGMPLSDEEFKSVKAKKLVEGRRRSLFVSAEVAAATDTVEDYLNKRGIDKAYCKRMIVELLEKKAAANREDIDGLLRKKLSDALSEDQKTNFIRNLLQEMRRDQIIQRIGAPTGSNAWWRLSKLAEE
jgi:ATP-dependent DNA helicase RecG